MNATYWVISKTLEIGCLLYSRIRTGQPNSDNSLFTRVSSHFGHDRSAILYEVSQGGMDIDIPADVPPGVDISRMCQEAKLMTDNEYICTVRPGGEWDFKRLDGKYENFGNFAYGYTAACHGWSLELSKFGAGLASSVHEPNSGAWSDIFDPTRISNYGDGVVDTHFVENGYRATFRPIRIEFDIVNIPAGPDTMKNE